MRATAARGAEGARRAATGERGNGFDDDAGARFVGATGECVEGIEDTLGECDVYAPGTEAEVGGLDGDNGPGSAGIVTIEAMFFDLAGVGDDLAFVDQSFEVKLDGFAGHFDGFVDGVGGGEAAGQVGDDDAVVRAAILVDYDGIVEVHRSPVHFQPADRKIARSVPMGKSFRGCGTVTRPGRRGCRNW